MRKTKTVTEKCKYCAGTGVREAYRIEEPDTGCSSCGGDGYLGKGRMGSYGGKKGSGKLKVTYLWDGSKWVFESSKAAKGWF